MKGRDSAPGVRPTLKRSSAFASRWINVLLTARRLGLPKAEDNISRAYHTCNECLYMKHSTRALLESPCAGGGRAYNARRHGRCTSPCPNDSPPRSLLCLRNDAAPACVLTGKEMPRCTGRISAPSAASASCVRVGACGLVAASALRAGHASAEGESSRRSCSQPRSSVPDFFSDDWEDPPRRRSSSNVARSISRPCLLVPRRIRPMRQRRAEARPRRNANPPTAPTARRPSDRQTRTRSSPSAARARRRGRRASDACAGRAAAGSTVA